LETLLLGILGTILTSLAAWAVERLIAFLNSRIKNTKALQFLTEAILIVDNSVKATYQTYVQALKDENMFTVDAQKEALSKALNQAQSQMSTEMKSHLTENFGDLTAWITSQIEAALYDLKNK
jgi:hypothetical protein